MKLDTIDKEHYLKARREFVKNQNTMNMLLDQYKKLESKNNYLFGRLEAITDQIVEKYGLSQLNCHIEDDGTITINS